MVTFYLQVRDLANQSYVRGKNSSLNLAKIIILVFFLLAIVWLLAGRAQSPTSTSGPIVLRDAPKGLTPVSLPDLSSVGQAVNLQTDKAVLESVGEIAGRATATRKYGDGTYTLIVEATLPDPKGLKYEVWLVGGDQPQEAGFLNGSGANWTLVFRDKDYYSKNDGIWITREITSDDKKPEKHMLEGRF